MRLTVAIVLLALLGACGFHLRGTVEGAGDWGAVHVLAVRDVPLEDALVSALSQAGGEVVADRAGAALIVELIEQNESRRTLSYTERARTAEYEVTGSLRYRVVDAEGRELLAERRIDSVRTYRIDRENLAATSQEEEILREEQSSDLVQQVVRSLDAAARARSAEGDDAGPG